MRPEFLFLLLISLTFYSQAQFEKVYPNHSRNQLYYEVYEVPQDSILLVSGKTTLFSSDSGQSWLSYDSFLAPGLDSPSFQNRDFTGEGVVYYSYLNKIYKSTDGGSNWELKLTFDSHIAGIRSGGYFNAMDFINKDTGYVVGRFEKILRTRDGGENWDTLKLSYSTGPYYSCTDVSFVNDTLGYVLLLERIDIYTNFGYKYHVLKTIDAGDTWTKTQLILDSYANYSEQTIQVLGIDSFFVQLSETQNNTNEIFRSYDGGGSFDEIPLPEAMGRSQYSPSCWLNDSTGLIYEGGSLRKLYRTEDAGHFWEEISIPVNMNMFSELIYDIYFTTYGLGVITGEGGLVLISEDQGKTWQVKHEPVPHFIEIDFTSEEEGWMSSGRGLYKTENAGSTWEYQQESDSLYFSSMKYEDTQNAIFHGYYNYNYLLDDGVMKALTLPVNSFFANVIKRNKNEIHAALLASSPSFHLVYAYSTDKGETWRTDSIAGGYSVITSMYLGEDSVKYISINATELYKCDKINGWHKVITFLSEDSKSAFGYLTNHVVLAGNNTGGLVRSEDGGETWHATNIPENVHISEFLKVNEAVAFAYGYKNKEDGVLLASIWYSENGGVTWVEELLPEAMYDRIDEMELEGNAVYAVGGYGNVYRKMLPPNVVLELEDKGVSDQAKLIVYPIPSRDDITVFLPQKGTVDYVSLTAMDGKCYILPYKYVEERRLVIDVSTVPKGMYVLQVNTRESSYTAKLVKE